MNGRVLAEELQQRHPRLRVLYTPGYPANAVAERGILDPGTALVQKPFSMLEPGQRLRAVLDAADASVV